MKFALKSIVAAAAFAAVGLANAESFTLHEGYNNNGLYMSGTSTWSFSNSLNGAVNAGDIQISAVAPATTPVTIQGGPPGWKPAPPSIIAPVQSFTSTFNGTTMQINEIRTTGGTLLTAQGDDFVSTGGALEITNLRVNLDTKKVYADLNGANGLGTQLGVDMWDITTINGATSFAALEGITTTNNSLTGLKINAPAFAMFSQALGLTIDGKTALSTVTDFGTINTTISVASVPEPSAYAMIGMGLLVIGAVGRRRKASMSQPTTKHVG